MDTSARSTLVGSVSRDIPRQVLRFGDKGILTTFKGRTLIRERHMIIYCCRQNLQGVGSPAGTNTLNFLVLYANHE